jgi:hypothetical protein
MRYQLVEQFHQFPPIVRHLRGKTGDVSTRPREAGDQTGRKRVTHQCDYGDGRSRPLYRIGDDQAG